MVSRKWEAAGIFLIIVSLGGHQKAMSGERIRNNFVTELLNLRRTKSEPHRKYKFSHHRDGWIFISATMNRTGPGRVWISLDSGPREEAVTVYRKGKTTIFEAMRLLPAGKHRISVYSDGQWVLKNLVVRSIPEILHFSYGSAPGAFGPYDQEFLQANGILDNVNVIIGRVNTRNRPFIEEWRRQGKKWMVGGNLPGKAEDAYEYWSSRIKDPLCDGILVDEFGPKPALLIYAEAIRRIHKDFPGKRFYPWMGHGFGGTNDGTYSSRSCDRTYKPFIRAVVEGGSKFVPERYLEDFCLTEAEARRDIESKLKDDMLRWQKAFPGCEREMIIGPTIFVLGNSGCSRNVNPNADYKVIMDLVYSFMARDPAFRDLYGIIAWMAGGADPETLRWLARLYRHYCIEGKTNMLSVEYGFRYVLAHIQNGDFEEDGKGWRFFPAEKESMAVKEMPQLGWWEGRKPEHSRRWQRARGNTFLWMKRSSKKPNIFSQAIRNLKPGKLYSLKMITGDFQNLTRNVSQKHAVSISLANVELIPEKTVQYVYRGNEQRYFNHHYRVFRATARKARLTVSDWLNDNDAGGPIGQEIICNFIELQPYLEE